MYSPSIIEKRLLAAKKAGLIYKRLPRADSIGRAAEIERLAFDPATQKRLPAGNLVRALKTSEQEFIESERLLCKADFVYFFERYVNISLDSGVGTDGGIGPLQMLESQRRYVSLLGKREEECWQEQAKYGFTTGIKAYFHKARQVLATTTARGMCWHRMFFYAPVRGLFATLDDTAITEVFTKRDHVFLDNLVWWLKPAKLDPDKDNDEIGIPAPISSYMAYRAENAESGFGTGSQNDVSHLTEVALYKYPSRIRYSFLPSLPKSIKTLHIQESTSDGKGNYWHEVTEHARKKDRGYEDWVYAFIPYYMNKAKYRANVPDSWVPEDHTLRHAEMVERTSPEFFDGVTIRPTKGQLYWWESERHAHAQNGELASFLTNYPATPSESFQSPSQGALPVELIEAMMNEAMMPGGVYEYETTGAANRE
jgi:hypothetical protein